MRILRLMGKKAAGIISRDRHRNPKDVKSSAKEGWLGLPSSEEQQELKRIRLKLFGTTGGNYISRTAFIQKEFTSPVLVHERSDSSTLTRSHRISIQSP